MLRADGPAEGDDSKKTNTAVALLTTDTMVEGKTPVGNDAWELEGKLKVQKIEGPVEPRMLVKIIEHSKIPLGEEEAVLHSIKGKLERDRPLSKEDEAFLTKLVERAKEWQRGTKSSEDTEPSDTMSG